MHKAISLLRQFGSNRVQAQVPEAWKGLEDSQPVSGADSRIIYAGPGAASFQQKHCGNDIHTAKYNVATFLPIFLFTMFSRVAYLYFLSQCALAYWSTISPFSPYGPTIALCFVLGVAAIKAIVEDKKRHDEDRKTNNSIAHLVADDGSVKDVRWREVKVGQLLEVRDNEDFPADLLCLACERSDGTAYIRTTNLDGETNLKIRRPVNLQHNTPSTSKAAADVHAVVQCESPNPDLHTFLGKLMYYSDGQTKHVVGLSMNEVLLRGCTLMNSKRVFGLVVYTGAETRIQQNSAAPPRKLGSFDGFLNVQIVIVLILQVSLCLGCAIGSYVWRENFGKQRYYLALDNGAQGNYQNGWAYVAVVFLTFWILFSYTIPISLFVTMEIIKFVLSNIFITFDPHMRDRIRREYPKARNSDIIEDLGLVDYVFSDKTGTLTSNEMQLRLLALKGVSFGSTHFKLEKQAPETSDQNLSLFDEKLRGAVSCLREHGYAPGLLAAGGSSPSLMRLSTSDPDQAVLEDGAVLEELRRPAPSPSIAGTPGRADMAAVVLEDACSGPLLPEMEAGLAQSQRAPSQQTAALLLGHHLVDFWTNLCVCHNLITEESGDDDLAVYQGPSPDEVALVEGGRQLGFEFVGRSRSSLVLRMLGHRVTHRILNTLDFTSQRARMSVVARSPDGTIRLFSKGADHVMIPRLRRQVASPLVASTQANLRLYSVQGLRTLLICSRVVPEEEWVAFNKKYEAAASSIEDRDQSLAAVAEIIERDYELIGVTAIEDKLQEGVPQAISTLVTAGIKVWMITGDKQETAINIATSCKLLRNFDKLLLCNAPHSRESARAKLRELGASSEKQDQQLPKQGLSGDGGLELVIDGMTLARILGQREDEMLLASLAVSCSAVIVCRASPAQKAAIVLMMKRYHAMKEAGEEQAGVRKVWRKFSSRLYAGLTGKHAGSSMRMLAIGDGANDVAMIQAAHIGVGIMGHEGRQATNNSDFAVSQFRFLVRLLLVHGSLATYRLARLIKYSFYKNTTFAFMLFYFQIFCGFSGQALLDGVTAAFYNAAFTALPIAAFAIWDRPVQNLSILADNPKTYNRKNPAELSAKAFWKTGLLQGVIHGAVVFFIPYFSQSASGKNTIDDVFSVGKTMFIALIGTVSLEIALVSKYWTKLFIAAWSLSYLLTFPWLVLIPLLYQAFNAYQVAQYGVGEMLLGSPTFWLSIILVYVITFSLRMGERAIHFVWTPTDVELLAEIETLERRSRAPPLAAQGGSLELQSYSSDQKSDSRHGKAEVGNASAPDPPHRHKNSSDESWLVGL